MAPLPTVQDQVPPATAEVSPSPPPAPSPASGHSCAYTCASASHTSDNSYSCTGCTPYNCVAPATYCADCCANRPHDGRAPSDV